MEPVGGAGAVGPGGILLQPGEQVLWVGGYRSSFDLGAPSTTRPTPFPSFTFRAGQIHPSGDRIVGVLVALVALFFVLPIVLSVARTWLPIPFGPFGLAIVVTLVVSAARSGAFTPTVDRRSGGAGPRPFAWGHGGSAVHTVATYLITDRRAITLDERGLAEVPLPQAVPTVVHRSAYGGTVVFEAAPGPRWGRIAMLNQSHEEIARIQEAVRAVNPHAAAMMPPPPPAEPLRPAPPDWVAQGLWPPPPPSPTAATPSAPGPVGGGPEPMSTEEQLSRWRRRISREQDPQPPTTPDPSPPSGPIIS